MDYNTKKWFSSLKKINLFWLCWVFVAALVVVSGGYSLAVVPRLLILVAFLVAEHNLWSLGFGSAAHGLSSCDSWALEYRLNSCGIWV